MDVIAITGGIASGKSTVADIFTKRHHITVIDSDEIARNLTQPHTTVLKQIVNKFGPDLINSDNSLNRNKLREIIFNNPEHKIWLEQLLHPLINQEIQNQLYLLKTNKLYTKKYCLVLIPLLDEKYLHNNSYINKILFVDCNTNEQVKRASKRDKQTTEQITKIIAQQIPREDQLKLAERIDLDIINNNDDINNLNITVDILHSKYNK